MIKICSLFSGSSGNSIFVSSNQQTKILVDAGMNGKQMQIAMNSIDESMDDIDGIMITHEHIDHIRGIGVVMRRHNIPVYVNRRTWEAMQRYSIGQIPANLVNIIESNKTFSIGDLIVESFATPHDAVESQGYRIVNGNKSVSVFTDIGEINDRIIDAVSGSDMIFIESNYDTKMLWEGIYPYMLKKRIDGVAGHLSNDDCAKAVFRLLGKGTTKFVLSHLSAENNLPSVALQTVKAVLDREDAVIGRDLEVEVARRSCPGIPRYL